MKPVCVISVGVSVQAACIALVEVEASQAEVNHGRRVEGVR
jgi:hypothetical protein